MKFSYQQTVRALILLAFSAMIFKLHFTGEISKFINPKYVILSQSASVIFFILFFFQLTRIISIKKHNDSHYSHTDHSCGHDHGNSAFNIKKLISYVIIIIPLLTGFFLPANVLDSSIAANKGGVKVLSREKSSKNDSSSSPVKESFENNNQGETALEDNSVEPSLIENQNEVSQEEYDQLIQQLETAHPIEMTDYVYNAYYEEISRDIDKYKERTIQLKGFVYKEDGFKENQLVLSRFLITHCVADASIIGFLSEFSEASRIEQDTWIEAKGVLDITIYNGIELPYIKITEWKEISEPTEPYLYPINIKIL